MVHKIKGQVLYRAIKGICTIYDDRKIIIRYACMYVRIHVRTSIKRTCRVMEGRIHWEGKTSEIWIPTSREMIFEMKNLDHIPVKKT